MEIAKDPSTDTKEKIDIYKWIVEMNVGKAKEQIEKLEEEYAQLGYELSDYTPEDEQNEELLEYASHFLGEMCTIREDLDVKSQNELKKFPFSDGLQFDGEKFATIQKSFPEELKNYIVIRNVSQSESPGTRTQHLLLKRQLL